MFSKLSRYRKLVTVTAPDGQGRVLASTELRLLPSVAGTFLHTVDSGDRLDQLGYKYYSQPLQWWNIADANPAFLSPLALLGKDAVVVTRFPLELPDGTTVPPWAAMSQALLSVLGVEDVATEESVQLTPGQVTVGAQTITAMVEQFTRAVLVTYNRLNIDPATLGQTIAAAGFVVLPFIQVDQLGQQIVIPPKPIG